MSYIYTKRFVAKTFKRTNELEIVESHKDSLRIDLINFLINEFKDLNGQVQFLTLPSAWWNFERLCWKHFKEEEMFFYTTACEKDRNIFKVAATRMPHTHSGFKYLYSVKHQTDKLASGVATLYYKDIFDYMEFTENKFNFIWLDLMCSLKWFLHRLYLVDSCTLPGSIVTITFSRSRDGKEYVGKRKVLVANLMESLGFTMLSDISYMDTSPMMQLTFKKR